jgi:4-amino-4-deoxy-L-arabinose transferase-like glycosyltransferase
MSSGPEPAADPSSAAARGRARASAEAHGGASASSAASDGAAGRRWDRLALAALVLQAVLLLSGAWRVGPTFDEHFYAAAGVAYLEEGALAVNREHPPLLKLLAGLPLVLAGVELSEHAVDARNFPVAFFYQREAENLRRNLLLARLPFCLLTLAVTWLVWRVGRRRFGPAAGAGAAALLALNPSVLAHGRLVSLDAGVTPFFLAAVLAFAAALERPSWRRRLGAAVLFGLANLAKFTSLVLGPAFVGLALVVAAVRRTPSRMVPLATLALTFLGGLGVFAAGYGFSARSLNAAWGSEHFVREVPPQPVTAEDLADAYVAAGGARADLAGVGDARAAVDRLIQASHDPARAARVARAFERLAHGPGELRKRAFERVLAMPAEHLGPDADDAEALRSRVLAALAGRGAPDRDAWQRLWEESRAESWDRTVLYHGWIERLTVGVVGYARPIPLLTAIKGVDQTLAHGAIGHGSFFRGRTLLPGRDFTEGNPHPEYYAVVMTIKNPLAWLALAAWGIGLALAPAGMRKLGLVGVLALVGVPAALFLVFSTGKALLGVRYLLPLYPFLALLGGRAFAAAPRVALALLAVAAAESLWIHPHELMYYNAAAGGPRGGPAITVVGDDWGQDALAVGRFLERYRDEIDAAGGLVYRPYTMADPSALGLAAAKPHTGPVEGIVAVHAVDYHREADEFRWLRDYEPFLAIGHAVYVVDTRGGPPGRDPLPEWEAGR